MKAKILLHNGNDIESLQNNNKDFKIKHNLSIINNFNKRKTIQA